MNGAWVMPEWEAATMALEKMQNEKKTETSSSFSSSGDKSAVKSTAATTASATTTPSTTSTAQNTMMYNPNFYSQYYGYPYLYGPYDMYGYGPYSPYGYMSFMGQMPQQMQPPPPPPSSSAASDKKLDSSSKQSQAASSTAVSSSTVTSNSSDAAAATKAGKQAPVVASAASTAQDTQMKALSASSATAAYSYPNGPWQSYASMDSSAAAMWSQFQGTAGPRPKFSSATGFQATPAPSPGSGPWARSAASVADTGRYSAGAARSPRPSTPRAMPSLRWSNSPRAGVNPYDGSFRHPGPKPSSEQYSPFDPTESEECEEQPVNNEHFGGFAPAPDAGNFRFRMPNRRGYRPMPWRQQSPRPSFLPEMQSPARGPMQQSPNFRFGQQAGQQRTPQPGGGSASSRPGIMPRMRNFTPRTRAPWTAGPESEKMQSIAPKPSMLQESLWDTDEAVSNRANADNRAAQSSKALDASSADEWPMALKQYVHRCFSSVKDDRAKDVMEVKLKELLTKAFGDGTALTHDWEHEPVPGVTDNSPSFMPLDSSSTSDRYGHPSSHPCSPRNFKFAGSLRGRRGTSSNSGSRQGRRWSPAGFHRRSRSHSHSRRSRSRSGSRSSSSSRRSSRSRHRRPRRHRDSRYHHE